MDSKLNASLKNVFDKNAVTRYDECVNCMMHIVFSDHALRQIKERRLTKLQIQNTVHKPTRITLQASRRCKAIRILKKEGKQYLLIVIYEDKGDTKEIITAFLTSKVSKYLLESTHL